MTEHPELMRTRHGTRLIARRAPSGGDADVILVAAGIEIQLTAIESRRLRALLAAAEPASDPEGPQQ